MPCVLDGQCRLANSHSNLDWYLMLFLACHACLFWLRCCSVVVGGGGGVFGREATVGPPFRSTEAGLHCSGAQTNVRWICPNGKAFSAVNLCLAKQLTPYSCCTASEALEITDLGPHSGGFCHRHHRAQLNLGFTPGVSVDGKGYGSKLNQQDMDHRF